METKGFLRLSCRGPLILIQLCHFPHFRFRNRLHFPNTSRTSRLALDFPSAITGVMRATTVMRNTLYGSLDYAHWPPTLDFTGFGWNQLRGGDEVLSPHSRVRFAGRLLPLLAALPAVPPSGIAQALPRDGIALGSSQGLALVNAYRDFVEGRKKEIVPRKPCLSRSASRAASPEGCTSSWARTSR